MTSIFIVEDDLSLQRLYEIMLTKFGFKVVDKACNGEEAIEKFMSFSIKPDVILMDHRMPVKNGIDTAIELLKINSHIKILFASADNSIKGRALEIGVISFIGKPFTVIQLHAEINRVVNLV
jgi:DNA-binding response OmpR family regulator